MIDINESLFLGMLVGAMIVIIITSAIFFLYQFLVSNIRRAVRDHEYYYHTDKNEYFNKKVKK